MMQKRLFLQGGIGSGKSTLLSEALSGTAPGGFLTRRKVTDGVLSGFALTPAFPGHPEQEQLFLSFSGRVSREDSVFSGLGVRLLKEAENHSFALLDEFGGLELLVPEFHQALRSLLSSDLPCIGVFKTRAAAEALSRRVPLGEAYAQRYRELEAWLQSDPDTLLLPFSQESAHHARDMISHWRKDYGK